MRFTQRQIQITFASIVFVLFALAVMLYLVAISAIGTTARYYISKDNDKGVARYYISDEKPDRYYIS